VLISMVKVVGSWKWSAVCAVRFRIAFMAGGIV